MMESAEIQQLFRYNQWANRIILNTAEKAGPEKFTTACSCSFYSLRGTLVHIYGAERIWHLRCEFGISPASLPGEKDFPDLAALRLAWEGEMQAMQQYIARLEDIKSPVIRYTNTRNVQFETPLWQILAHVVNHGTQFRSEAGLLLSSWDFSPGDVDMIAFFRQS